MAFLLRGAVNGFGNGLNGWPSFSAHHLVGVYPCGRPYLPNGGGGGIIELQFEEDIEEKQETLART